MGGLDYIFYTKGSWAREGLGAAPHKSFDSISIYMNTKNGNTEGELRQGIAGRYIQKFRMSTDRAFDCIRIDTSKVD